MEKTEKNIITALKYYIPIRYWKLNDWKTIVSREEEVEKNIFQYKCSFYKLYFNEKLEPVHYAEQKVIDDEVFYDTSNDNPNIPAYTYLGKLNWDKQHDWGL